MTCRKTDIIF